jgi:hypothetical protein
VRTNERFAMADASTETPNVTAIDEL